MSNFYALINRMKYIRRWCLMRSNNDENLFEHSFQVAVIAHALALIKNKKFSGGVDAEFVATASLFHDSSEVITGDMPTPVKYNNPSLKNAYKDFEKMADEKLLSMLPDFLKEDYEKLFNLPSDSAEYKIIKAADKISAYIKCAEETSAGNSEFSIAEKTTLEAIRAMNLPEAEYFMDNCVEGFFKPLDVL
ncbi:MAG: 5'-deoxynucleotidase [Eubacteriales bacterium]|nr:5'-deoxynucleotidase [Christensenellaceae bacterium]MDY3242237.1 5'-deoxynucleotidase [Eubacteriales bacterium]